MAPSPHRKKHRYRLLLRLGLVACALVFLAATYFLLKAQKDVAADAESTEYVEPTEPADVVANRQAVDALVAQFKDSEAAGNLEEAARLLDEAQVRQKAVIAAITDPFEVRGEEARAEELQALADGFAAAPLYDQSVRAEQSAAVAAKNKLWQEARGHLESAIDLQQTINDDYALAPQRNLVRVQKLRQELREMLARPIRTDSEIAEARAKEALEDERFADAETHLEDALSKELALLDQYRDTSFASLARKGSLEKQLADLKARETADQIAEQVRSAEAAEAAGDYPGAAAKYAAAFEAQRTLNADYPLSRFASNDRRQQLDVARQTAESQPLFARIQSASQRLEKALLERRRDDVMAVTTELADQLRKLREDFPNSRHDPGDLEARVTYIGRVKDAYQAVVTAVDPALVPVPGTAGLRVLRTEVPQSLFSAVTDANPSVAVGERLPVDSVTWEEAADFSVKLGWLLGQPVRLPKRDELVALVPDADREAAAAAAWNNVTGTETREVGTSKAVNGAFDVLGNVEEWTAEPNPEDPAEALVFGGSARDNPAHLRTLPQRYRPKLERARFIGFRIVVEPPETNPSAR